MFTDLSAQERIHFLFHPLIHPDQGRPFTFETFAGKFRGGVDAEFAADGDFAGSVVEHGGRPFGEN